MANQTKKPLTLTQASSAARQLILVGGITVLFIIIGRFLLTSATTFWIRTHPAPPPPPTMGFGILPALVFPANVGNPTSYSLQVPQSKLPQIPDRLKVYFIPSKRPSLFTSDRASAQAKSLGFLFDPSHLSDTMYRWNRTQPLPSTLDMNIETGTFTMKLDWQSNPGFLTSNALPTEDDAISKTKSFLIDASLLPKDVATGSAKVSYLKASGTTYASAVSLSESDFLQIDIYRANIDSLYDTVTDVPNQGIIRSIVTGNQDQNSQFALIEYHYLPIDYTKFETYYIISPQEAYQMLTAQKGFTAAMPTGTNAVIIRSLRLSYYDSFSSQDYLQPVYVFEGDGGYVGYVPAIKQLSVSNR